MVLGGGGCYMVLHGGMGRHMRMGHDHHKHHKQAGIMPGCRYSVAVS